MYNAGDHLANVDFKSGSDVMEAIQLGKGDRIFASNSESPVFAKDIDTIEIMSYTGDTTLEMILATQLGGD